MLLAASILFAPWEGPLEGPFIIPTSHLRKDGGDGSVGPTVLQYTMLTMMNAACICACLVSQPQSFTCATQSVRAHFSLYCGATKFEPLINTVSAPTTV